MRGSRQAAVFDVSPALFRKRRRERSQSQVEANKLWGENPQLLFQEVEHLGKESGGEGGGESKAVTDCLFCLIKLLHCLEVLVPLPTLWQRDLVCW